MIFTIGHHCLFPRDDAASRYVNSGPPLGSNVELSEVRGSKFSRGVHASLTRVGNSLGLAATPSFGIGPEAYQGYLSRAHKRALIAKARA